MNSNYILWFLLAFIGLSCAVLLVIFLASVALYGSLILVSICLGVMVLYFVGVSKLSEDKEEL
jgi:hypothetical protein